MTQNGHTIICPGSKKSILRHSVKSLSLMICAKGKTIPFRIDFYVRQRISFRIDSYVRQRAPKPKPAAKPAAKSRASIDYFDMNSSISGPS